MYVCMYIRILQVGVIVSDLLFALNGVGDCRCVLISLPVAVRSASDDGDGDGDKDCWMVLLLLLLLVVVHVASLFEYLLLMFLWT